MEVLAKSLQNGLDPSAVVNSTIDPYTVVNYLVAVLTLTVGATTRDLETHNSLLSKEKKSETVQRCTRFALEPQTVIYILKDTVPPEHTDGTNGTNGSSTPDSRRLLCDVMLALLISS